MKEKMDANSKHIQDGSYFAKYSNYAEFKADYKVLEYIEKLLESAKVNNIPDSIDAYCDVCKKITSMRSNKIGYTEYYVCCGMNSRMRAIYEYIINHFHNGSKVYVMEAVTPAYCAYEKYFGIDNIVGSEFLGNNKTGGVKYSHNGQEVMHQDCTKLSFENEYFDLIISQHVLEHIYNLRIALKESLRILKPGGQFVLSIPFFFAQYSSVMLAKLLESGEIEQIIKPPEIHGNPVGEGSLAFWHVGWDILDIMREIGYRQAEVIFYNNENKGHFGPQSMIVGQK